MSRKNNLFSMQRNLTVKEFKILYYTEYVEVNFWKKFIILDLPISNNFNTFTMNIILKDIYIILEKKDFEFFGVFSGRIYILINKEITKEELKQYFLNEFDFIKLQNLLRDGLQPNKFFDFMFWFNKYNYFDINVMSFITVDQLFNQNNNSYNFDKYFYSKSLERFSNII